MMCGGGRGSPSGRRPPGPAASRRAGPSPRAAVRLAEARGDVTAGERPRPRPAPPPPPRAHACGSAASFWPVRRPRAESARQSVPGAAEERRAAASRARRSGEAAVCAGVARGGSEPEDSRSTMAPIGLKAVVGESKCRGVSSAGGAAAAGRSARRTCPLRPGPGGSAPRPAGARGREGSVIPAPPSEGSPAASRSPRPLPSFPRSPWSPW